MAAKAAAAVGAEQAPAAERKDPGIAALISVVCTLLSAPAAGYFYLGKMKKGIIYLIAAWVLLGIVIGIVVVASGAIVGLSTLLALVCPLFAIGWLASLCPVVLFVFPLAFDIVIIYDVYLEAKGAKALLPFSGE